MVSKADQDGYKIVAIHLALAVTSVAISAAVVAGLFITRSGWCVLGLLVIVGVYEKVFGDVTTSSQEEGAETQTT